MKNLHGRTVLVLLAAAIVAGCPLPISTRTGSVGSKLIITIDGAPTSPGSAQTLVPVVSGLVASYSILLQTGSTSRSVSSATSPVSVEGLDPGAWTVTVSGLDSSGQVVAQGSRSVTLQPHQPLSTTVTLSFLQGGGTGGIEISVAFPHSVGIDSVDATLSESALVSPPISVNGATDTVTIARAGVAAGSPILRVFLRKAGVILATVTESVWVFQNVTTGATLTLQSTDFGSAPAAPTGLSVAAQHDGSLLLAWTDNSNIADAYVVRRSGSAGGPYTQVGPDLAFNATGLTDTGLPAATACFYQVTAKNRFGESAAATATAATFAVVAAPAISPAPSGTFPESQLITLSSATAGAAIYYATDGSVPSALSIPYTGPFPMTASGTTLSLKAIAVAGGMTDSSVSAATYTVDRKPAISGFSASSPSLFRGQSVTLSVSAQDPEGEILTYTYSPPAGITITGAGASVTATAVSLGAQSISVTVDDGHGNAATATLTLTVSNQAPTLSLVVPSGGTLWNTGTDTRTLSFTASDPEGDTPLTYSYSVTSAPGTGSVTGSGSSALFTTGTAAGMSTVHVVVADSQGAQTALDVQMKVFGWRPLVSTPDPTYGVPAARSSPSAVAVANGTVILFGGQDAAGTTLYNDVWRYAAATQTWTMMNPNQASSTTYPAKRTWHAATFEPVSGKVIIFGGYDPTTSTTYGDTWAYSPTAFTWTRITPTGNPPGGTAGTPIVANGTGSVLIPVQSNNIYTVNVATSASTSRVAYSVNSQYFMSGIWDSINSRLVIFAGQTPMLSPTSFSNAVIADNYSPTTWWTTLHAGGTDATNTVYPSPRSGQSAIYDGAGTMIVFGGKSGGTPMNDVWAFAIGASSGTWTRLTSVNGPTARYYHKAVFYADPALGRTMLVFGTLSAGDTTVWQYIVP